MTKNQIIAEKDGSLTINVNAGEVTLVNKDLTDEEISWFVKAYTDPKGKLNINEFARAIQRKSRE
jgi:Ca2+-binding EF-hand superfamily protein